MSKLVYNSWKEKQLDKTNPYISVDHETAFLYSEFFNMPTNFRKVPLIKKVIFNSPATIVFWSDKTKTVVKAENESFDPEKGLAMAITKKALGNKGNYFNEFKKWLPEEKIITKKIKLRQYSARICDIFENLLDAHNITIYDEDRQGEEGEARLYGMTYATLEDLVTYILYNLMIDVDPDVIINSEEY